MFFAAPQAQPRQLPMSLRASCVCQFLNQLEDKDTETCLIAHGAWQRQQPARIFQPDPFSRGARPVTSRPATSKRRAWSGRARVLESPETSRKCRRYGEICFKMTCRPILRRPESLFNSPPALSGPYLSRKTKQALMSAPCRHPPLVSHRGCRCRSAD